MMLTPTDYIQLTNHIFELIIAEIDDLQSSQSPPAVEAVLKLPVMYEFFRFLRGEAFSQTRPVTPNQQSNFYRMEDILKKKISKLFSQLDFQDSKTQYHLQQSKQIFEKSYFGFYLD